MKTKGATAPIRIAIFFLVALIVLLGGYAWWHDGMSAVDADDATPLRFVINKGESIKSISSRLAEDDIIRSSTAFFVLVKFLGIDQEIQAGEFRLNKAMDASTVAQELTHGIIDQWVTTLEGWRVDEVANELAKELDIPEQEFLRVAKEGYMFPDTYLIPQTASASAIAELFLRTFDEKITPQMREDAEKNGLTLEEVVTLASIVEREGISAEDRPVIAGILLNRIEQEWPLQADATVQYALGYQPSEKSWWKKSLTYEDLEIESPYNTYVIQGLPPGPISNPGFSSIQAVIYPKETEFMFYLHDSNGGLHTAKTLEGHNSNIEKYLQ